ncbi:MAG: FAD-binding oxidoreductase [Candidatus Rokubacteria bacterium]|nr:FAD-binding oxidoreductase [Candidatus Rokubacteria bacterium]
MDRGDAVVIGGGVMGASIAYHLARRGVGRTVLLEKATVCSGTSAKSSAIVRTHYTTRPTATMALLARRMMETFREDVGAECGFVRTGMLVIGTAEGRDGMAQTVAMNRELGIETGFVSREEARRIDPLVDPPEGAPIVYEPRSGYGNPHDVAQSYARRFVELGGVLHQGAEVTAIDTAGGRVRAVRSTGGDVTAGAVVIAAGPWAQRVGRLAGIDLPVAAYRESIVTLHPRVPYGNDHPVVADLGNGVYFRPETGGFILLGSTREPPEPPGDPDRYEDRPYPAYVEDVVGRLARVMPAAVDAEIAGGWSGMYEVTPDWNPIMGQAAGLDGLYYCVGFSGHGFKLSPAAGLLMAELMAAGRASTLDLSPYRLERFAEGHAFRIAYPQASVIA